MQIDTTMLKEEVEGKEIGVFNSKNDVTSVIINLQRGEEKTAKGTVIMTFPISGEEEGEAEVGEGEVEEEIVRTVAERAIEILGNGVTRHTTMLLNAYRITPALNKIINRLAQRPNRVNNLLNTRQRQ